jgi:excisionase family DNA binding protein
MTSTCPYCGSHDQASGSRDIQPILRSVDRTSTVSAANHALTPQAFGSPAARSHFEGNRDDNQPMTEVDHGKLLLTPEEAAGLLSVGRSRVYDLMRAHLLQGVKIGRSRRVLAASLRDYVATLAREGEYE